MSQFIVRDTDRGNERPVDSRAEAEEVKQDLEELGATVEIIPLGDGENQTASADGGVEVVDHTVDESPTETDEPPQTPATPKTAEALDELGESLGTDPLDILPGHMIDQIQGQPAINKRGYAMIAERYGVSVKATIESYPWENDDNRCVASAVATTEDGKEYRDYATASKDDGDMSEQLIELASTRALKRCVGWATGLGIVSYQELSNQLEDEL